MEQKVKDRLIELAAAYNNTRYFRNDPIIFPKHFAVLCSDFNCKYAEHDLSLVNDSCPCYTKTKQIRREDVEISAILAAHLAWGRRDMIVRDCNRMFDAMNWKPFEYVMNGNWKNNDASLHRTIKWSEFAFICSNLQRFFKNGGKSLEELDQAETRTEIYGQKTDPNAANKKINMMRRWMVRDDGIVDLGLWKNTSRKDLIIPLDVHVHRTAMELGLTNRNSANMRTAMEITEALRKVFPEDPCLGDFALFAWSVTQRENKENNNKN